eukprot:scaffold38062_cov23-Cyclotella_meneghiniana.AAC.3
MTDHHYSNFDGLSSLISFAGVSIPARAKFIAQFVGTSLFSSLTLGLVAGQTASTFLTCGPLIPFMTGSWIGYTWGCVGFWRLAERKMVECARRYPDILAHSLITNMSIIPPHHLITDINNTNNDKEEGVAIIPENKNKNDQITLEQWIKEGGIGRVSYAILAAQSCEEDVQEMYRNERQRIVDRYNNRD